MKIRCLFLSLLCLLPIITVAQHPLNREADVTINCLFYRVIGTFLPVEIINVDEFSKIDIFSDSQCLVESSVRLVANLGDQSITVGSGGGGIFLLGWHASARAVAGMRNVMIIPGLTPVTPLVVSGATNTSPIVITSVGHDLITNDSVTIIGVGGNTAANGDWIIQNADFDTFTIHTLSLVDSSGNGSFTTPGQIPIFYSGRSKVVDTLGSSTLALQSNALGRFRAGQGDMVSLYVANLSNDSNIEFEQVALEMIRVIVE